MKKVISKICAIVFTFVYSNNVLAQSAAVMEPFFDGPTLGVPPTPPLRPTDLEWWTKERIAFYIGGAVVLILLIVLAIQILKRKRKEQIALKKEKISKIIKQNPNLSYEEIKAILEIVEMPIAFLDEVWNQNLQN